MDGLHCLRNLLQLINEVLNAHKNLFCWAMLNGKSIGRSSTGNRTSTAKLDTV